MREDEGVELDTLARSACVYDIQGGADTKPGKANILLQVIVHGWFYEGSRRVPGPSGLSMP